jgi:integrase
MYTGQRLADLAALTWDNLDLRKNEIRLRTRKTARRIMVPMAKPLRNILILCQPISNPKRQFTPRHSKLSLSTVDQPTSVTILPIYWRRQGCAKGRRTIGAKEKVGVVKEHRTVSAFIHSAIQP